ncbi:MAG: hypothetical protein JXR41_00815 [Bacteroidales bacterium]|nr:hypothetical protein [Bacteroidales bacterium]MBN2761602.1 hypothetical protein [Bacteroidales bacterium]
MKTTSVSLLLILFALFSCNSKEISEDQSVSFGIYETVKFGELPAHALDSLKVTTIHFESDPQSPVIGYLPKSDPGLPDDLFTTEGIRLLKAIFPVDQEGQNLAVIAVNHKPAIVLSDIQKTKNNGRNVQIYLTLKGAKKLADLTKKNTGKSIAIAVDDIVYSMPMVNGVIKGGVAMISGLESETMAKELSDRLNKAL